MDLLGETVLQTEDHQTGCSHCSQQSNNYYINYSLQKKTTLDYVGCYGGIYCSIHTFWPKPVSGKKGGMCKNAIHLGGKY